MNKAVYIMVAVLLMPLALVFGTSQVEQGNGVSNQYCPVTEELIDPAFHVEHKGETVFFCCYRCRKKVLADPDAYIGALTQFAQPAQLGHEEMSSGHGSHEGYESEAGDHDHARDHGAPVASLKPLKFLGKFHPLAVHFPIALILTACLAEGLSLWKRYSGFAEFARFALTLGAAGAVTSASVGWLAAAGASYPADLTRALFLHRWIGVSVATFSTVAAILSHLQKSGPTVRNAYLVCLVISAGLVGAAGHLGATLIYGVDYFSG